MSNPIKFPAGVMTDLDYIHLIPNHDPPDFSVRPFKAVVIAEESVTAEWRQLISRWLVRSGCLFMLAWGHECSLWDDSVDHANLEEFDYGDIPDDRFVMTTWHDSEPLSEVLWFAVRSAANPSVTLDRVALIHIAKNEDRSRIMKAVAEALDD